MGEEQIEMPRIEFKKQQTCICFSSIRLLLLLLLLWCDLYVIELRVIWHADTRTSHAWRAHVHRTGDILNGLHDMPFLIFTYG